MTGGDRFATMIGFAKRAGKIVYGFDCLKTAKRVAVLAVSDTASDNLKNGMTRLAEARELPLIYADALEAIVGNNVKALGITDKNMAQAMLEYAQSGAPHYRT